MSSRQNVMLNTGIAKIGNSLTGQLYEKKLSSDGLIYFSATLNEPVTFTGVMHTSSSNDLQEDTNSTNSVVTLETGLNIENLFGDNGSLVFIISNVENISVDGLVVFGKQNDYNRVADICHYIGQVIPSELTSFVLANGEVTPLLNFNSIPLWLSLDIYEGIPIYAGFSMLSNRKAPYIVANIINTGAYSFPILDNTGELDNWLYDDVGLIFINVEANVIQRILYSLFQNAQNNIQPVINNPMLSTTLENIPDVVADLSLKKQYYQGRVNYHFSQTNIAFQKILDINIKWSTL